MRVPPLLRLFAACVAITAGARASDLARVAYLGTPGSARVESFRAFLETRCEEVVVGDWRTVRSTEWTLGDFDVLVLDGARDDGLPFLPIREFDAGFGEIATNPIVLVGAAGRLVARGHRLMGADGVTDDGRSVRVAEHPALGTDPAAAEVRVALAGRRFGARLSHLAGEPSLEVLSVTSGGDDPELPVVFRQGNLLHFGFDAAPDALTPDGRELLAACIGYASRFREYHHAAEPFERARPVPRADLTRLGLDPADEAFPVEVARRAATSTDAVERAAARRLLARYLPDGPSPFAHPSRWEEWLGRYRPSLAFSRWRGDRWVVDALARVRRVPSAELRGPARASKPGGGRRGADGAVSDDDVRRAVDHALRGISEAENADDDRTAEITLLRVPDRAALEIDRRLGSASEPESRRRLLRLLGRRGRDGVHGFASLRSALASDDPALRRAAATALGELGAAGVPALEEALLDDDATVRRRAAAALFVTGHEATPAAPSLATALGDPDDAVRATAALALLRCRELDDAVVSAVAEATTDRDETVRFWARATRERHRPRRPADRVVKVGAPLADDERATAVAALSVDAPELRTRAAFALARRSDVGALDDETRGRIDAALDEWVAAQVESTDDDFLEMGTGSENVLRNVDLALPGMVSDLLRYPRFPVGPVSFQPHLPILRRAEEAAVPAWVLCLDHWYMDDTIGIEGLSHLGREARYAWPALVAQWSRRLDWPGDAAFLRGDGRWFEDETDQHVLLADELVPELRGALAHDDDVVRAAAAALLRTLNPLHLADEGALVARLTDDEPDPVGVVDALARRPLDAASRAALLRFLAARDRQEVQVVALPASERLGDDWTPPPAATVAASVRATDPRVVSAALRHLEHLGPAAAAVVPSLRDALVPLAGGLHDGRADLFRIKRLPRGLAAAGPVGLEALAAVYPSFVSAGAGLRRTDSGRYGPRDPCVEVEVALLTAGAPAEAALRRLLEGPAAPAERTIRAECEWLADMFRATP